MSEKKVIYVRRGQVLTVECLHDVVTNTGYFVVKDKEGFSVEAKEIVTEDVIYSAEQQTRYVYKMADGRWLEWKEYKQAVKDSPESPVDIMEIPISAPKPISEKAVTRHPGQEENLPR